MGESKISKSKNSTEPAITAATTDLYKRAEQALAAGYSLVAVDAATLKKVLDNNCHSTIMTDSTKEEAE